MHIAISIDLGTTGCRAYAYSAAGTVLVKDIYPLGSCSNPVNFAEVGGVLFFSADDASKGFELWRSDGTEAGTVLRVDQAAELPLDAGPPVRYEYTGREHPEDRGRNARPVANSVAWRPRSVGLPRPGGHARLDA
mgnify:CR=1 FL=1